MEADGVHFQKKTGYVKGQLTGMSRMFSKRECESEIALVAVSSKLAESRSKLWPRILDLGIFVARSASDQQKRRESSGNFDTFRDGK